MPTSAPRTAAKPAHIEPVFLPTARLELDEVVAEEAPAAPELVVLIIDVVLGTDTTLVIKLAYLVLPVPTTVTVE